MSRDSARKNISSASAAAAAAAAAAAGCQQQRGHQQQQQHRPRRETRADDDRRDRLPTPKTMKLSSSSFSSSSSSSSSAPFGSNRRLQSEAQRENKEQEQQHCAGEDDDDDDENADNDVVVVVVDDDVREGSDYEAAIQRQDHPQCVQEQHLRQQIQSPAEWLSPTAPLAEAATRTSFPAAELTTPPAIRETQPSAHWAAPVGSPSLSSSPNLIGSRRSEWDFKTPEKRPVSSAPRQNLVWSAQPGWSASSTASIPARACQTQPPPNRRGKIDGFDLEFRGFDQEFGGFDQEFGDFEQEFGENSNWTFQLDGEDGGDLGSGAVPPFPFPRSDRTAKVLQTPPLIRCYGDMFCTPSPQAVRHREIVENRFYPAVAVIAYLGPLRSRAFVSSSRSVSSELPLGLTQLMQQRLIYEAEQLLLPNHNLSRPHHRSAQRAQYRKLWQWLLLGHLTHELLPYVGLRCDMLPLACEQLVLTLQRLDQVMASAVADSTMGLNGLCPSDIPGFLDLTFGSRRTELDLLPEHLALGATATSNTKSRKRRVRRQVLQASIHLSFERVASERWGLEVKYVAEGLVVRAVDPAGAIARATATLIGKPNQHRLTSGDTITAVDDLRRSGPELCCLLRQRTAVTLLVRPRSLNNDVAARALPYQEEGADEGRSRSSNAAADSGNIINSSSNSNNNSNIHIISSGMYSSLD